MADSSTFQVGDLTVTYTITSREAGKVTLDGTVTRGGATVPISWPVIVVNPPVMATAEDGSLVEDAALALAQVVADVARG